MSFPHGISDDSNKQDLRPTMTKVDDERGVLNISLVDPTTPAQKLAIGADGSLTVVLTAGKATRAAVITANADIDPTSGITANVDTDATVLFAGDTTAVAVKLLAGVVYPYSIIKVTVGDNILALY